MFIEKIGEYEDLVKLNTLHKNLKSAETKEAELGFIERISKKLGLSIASELYSSGGNKIKFFIKFK